MKKTRRLLAFVLSIAVLASVVVINPMTSSAVQLPENSAIAREAASEGIVLLENKGVLPLKATDKVALFGFTRHMNGSSYPTDGFGKDGFITYGGGSGEATAPYVTDLLEGMTYRKDEGKLALVNDIGSNPTAAQITAAAESNDVAVVVIRRWNAEASDISAGAGGYLLSASETTMIQNVTAAFENVVVVMNSGTALDMTWTETYPSIRAVVYTWYPGMEGGNALADVLCGVVNPSGKLVDTFARNVSDYASTATFAQTHPQYTDDIYVGYRYFATVDPEYAKVKYEFGFGLSYSNFAIADKAVKIEGNEVVVSAKVTNNGPYPGKEVVQAYYSAPAGALNKPAFELAAYAKTSLLAVDASETVEMRFPIDSMASYDDVGKTGAISAYVLEAGDYNFYVGNSVKNATKSAVVGKYAEPALRVVEQLSKQLTPPTAFDRLIDPINKTYQSTNWTPEGGAPTPGTPNPKPGPAPQPERKAWTGEGAIMLEDVYKEPGYLYDFVEQMTDAELRTMSRHQGDTKHTGGTGAIGKLAKYGIPEVDTADGPAGVRIGTIGARVVEATCFPISTLMACTWNTELIEKAGVAVGKEMKANKIDIWLAPGMNIHRHPRNGRNFEYYSEDPLVAGKSASALTKGVQSVGGLVTLKHFAANNQETNRYQTNSQVSERALREIYLKGFEIAVKEADPGCIMTSYNRINGSYAEGSYALLTSVLRNEWGFRGLVMTDWWNGRASSAVQIAAGCNIKMDDNDSSINTVSREALLANIRGIMGPIMRSFAFQDEISVEPRLTSLTVNPLELAVGKAGSIEATVVGRYLDGVEIKAGIKGYPETFVTVTGANGGKVTIPVSANLLAIGSYQVVVTMNGVETTLTGSFRVADQKQYYYLVAARNNKIVGADPGTFANPSNATTMVANLDEVNDYAKFEIRNLVPDVVHLVAMNGYYITMEGSSWGNQMVRPRTATTGTPNATGWEALRFEDQDDGTIKIKRIGSDGTWYINVAANGNLSTVQNSVGDTGKFTLVKIEEPLPSDGDSIYLVAASNGKIIGSNDRDAAWTGSNTQTTLAAGYDEITAENQAYILYTVEYNPELERYYLKAGNNKYVTIEGPSWGGTAIRPRTDAKGAAATAWEALVLELQDDGSIKICKQIDTGVKYYINVTANGTLAYATPSVGDSGKLRWFKSGVVPPKDPVVSSVEVAPSQIQAETATSLAVTVVGKNLDGADVKVGISGFDSTFVSVSGAEGGIVTIPVSATLLAQGNYDIIVTVGGTPVSVKAALTVVEKESPLPKEGDIIYLVAARNGKIVGADAASFDAPTSAQPTMVANLDEANNYAKLVVTYKFDQVLLKATNGRYVTVEGAIYGDNKVRPRTLESEISADGWESMLFEVQADDTVKILRTSTVDGTFYIDVAANGNLVSVANTVGDTGKFQIVKVGTVIPEPVKPRENGDAPTSLIYKDPNQPIEVRIKDLLDQMTIDEKLGQSLQYERGNVSGANAGNIATYYAGSVLSGGGSTPSGNNQAAWVSMVTEMQNAALRTPLQIPVLYEIDAVHGNGNIRGVTVFPHNATLGAGADVELMEKIGKAVAAEMRAFMTVGNFAPCIPSPQNVRWGRAYEGFGENYDLNGALGAAYVRGIQGGAPADYSGLNTDAEHPNQFAYLNSPSVAVATMKHFFGEGVVPNGVNRGNYVIEGLPSVTSWSSGNMNAANRAQYDAFRALSPETLLSYSEITTLLAPYKALTEAGARSMMPSFSSVNGIKMHDQKALINLLTLPKDKGGLGFTGFVVSDYNVHGDGAGANTAERHVSVYNAGVDLMMLLSPSAGVTWVNNIKAGIQNGTVSMERVNDATARLLRVKFELGLFEKPIPTTEEVEMLGAQVFGAEHQAIAREAVRESIILLKNDDNIVGKLAGMKNIMVAGRFANDMGRQAGGWTISWQGQAGNNRGIAGTTIRDALQAAGTAKGINVAFNETGVRNADDVTKYDALIFCLGEVPYAEDNGDAGITAATGRGTLQMAYDDLVALNNIKANYPGTPIIAITVSGRPLVINNQIDDFAGLVHAGWIGSAGEGVADVLLGEFDFAGKANYPWAWYSEWIGDKSKPAMFPLGYGLKKGETGAALVKPDRQGAPVAVVAGEAATISGSIFTSPVYSKSGNISSTTLVSPTTGSDAITGRNYYGDVFVEYKLDAPATVESVITLNTSRGDNSADTVSVSIDGGEAVVYTLPSGNNRTTANTFNLSKGEHILRIAFPSAAASTTVNSIAINSVAGTDPEPVIDISFGVVESLVAARKANLPVYADVADGSVAKFELNGAVIATGVFNGGVANIALSAVNVAAAGEYDVAVYDAEAKQLGVKKIDVIEENVNIWTANAESVSNNVYIVFNPIISLIDSASITVNGKATTISNLGERNILLGLQMEDLPLGENTFVVKGVRFPKLYPSYSFTFTFSQDKNDI